MVFAFLVGGYQDRLAASTLRQIGRPVYESVVTLADANFRAFEVSRQLQGTVQAEPDVLIWFVDRDSTVVSEASRNPRFRGEQLELDLTDVGEGANGFVDGTVRTGDGTRLNYMAAGLPTDAADRFNAAYVVLALPTENRQTVLGDLTWRLILGRGVGAGGRHGGGAAVVAVDLPALAGHEPGRPRRGSGRLPAEGGGERHHGGAGVGGILQPDDGRSATPTGRLARLFGQRFSRSADALDLDLRLLAGAAGRHGGGDGGTGERVSHH